MDQQVFSKPGLVNLISKTQTWYSIYQFTHCFTLQTSDYDVLFDFCVNQKVQCPRDLIKAHAVR